MTMHTQYLCRAPNSVIIVTANISGYTPLPVETCMRSWKAIEVMAVPSSDLVTRLAWYSRTPRMRRGPNINVCTTRVNWITPTKTPFIAEVEYCWNDERISEMQISIVGLHTKSCGEKSLSGREETATKLVRSFSGKVNDMQIMSEPCEVKHMTLY
jgi:hypothetical protein